MLKRFVPVFSLAAMIGTAAFAQSPVAVTVNKAMLKVQQDPPPVTFTSPKTIVQLNCDGIDCAKLSSSEVTLESDVNAPKQRTFEFTDADFKQTKDVFIDSDETGNRRTVVRFTSRQPLQPRPPTSMGMMQTMYGTPSAVRCRFMPTTRKRTGRISSWPLMVLHLFDLSVRSTKTM